MKTVGYFIFLLKSIFSSLSFFRLVLLQSTVQEYFRQLVTVKKRAKVCRVIGNVLLEEELAP